MHGIPDDEITTFQREADELDNEDKIECRYCHNTTGGAEHEICEECHANMTPPQDALRESKNALREIKLEALTCRDARKGLSHIIRLCICAGITEKLDDLKQNSRYSATP